jgi:hypothetical protein
MLKPICVNPTRIMTARGFPPALSIQGYWRGLRREGRQRQKLASASLIFSVFLPVHEDYRRDFEVPEFRFSEAVIVRPI